MVLFIQLHAWMLGNHSGIFMIGNTGYTRIECTLHTREDHSELEHGPPDVGKSVDSKDENFLPANYGIADSCCSAKGPPGVGNRDAMTGGATQAPHNKRARK